MTNDRLILINDTTLELAKDNCPLVSTGPNAESNKENNVFAYGRSLKDFKKVYGSRFKKE